MNVSNTRSPRSIAHGRHRPRRAWAIVLATALLAGCTASRDPASRFRGATRSVNVFRIDGVATSPWSYEPKTRAMTLQQTVTLRETLPTAGLYVSMLASFEVFWDGERIGQSGVIDADGNAAAPGPMDNFFAIPVRSAGAEPHDLTLRVAVPRANSRWFQGVVVGDYQRMLRSRIIAQFVPLAGVVLFLAVGAYFLMLDVATDRLGATRTFALLCVASAFLAVAETWRWTIGYSYDWHSTRLIVVTVLTFVVALLLPAYFLLERSVERARMKIIICALALAGVAAVPASSDTRCLALFATSVLICGAIVALRPSRIGVLAVTILLAALVAGGYGFSDTTFFVAFSLVVVCLLIRLVGDLRSERREYETSVLKATRLELDLLQKTIQPHFVMNTLTAVMEWLEQDPAAGVAFLESFADELRILASVSGRATIRVAEELALCRSHLSVMACRHDTRYRLRLGQVVEQAEIPPAVFHTLIENALTHNAYGADDVEFVLTETRADGIRRYVFDAPLAAASPFPNGEGTGLRYVKARLEDRYPGRWLLDSHRADTTWRTTIEVPA